MAGADLGVRPNSIAWMECLLLQRARTCRLNQIYCGIGILSAKISLWYNHHFRIKSGYKLFIFAALSYRRERADAILGGNPLIGGMIRRVYRVISRCSCSKNEVT